MKKYLLLLALLFTLQTFSQAITVNTNTYSVPQLVTNVLINSPCVSATNITWSTGTNFGSSNGIGYFQNTNPSFPMQSGVILTTGSATNSAGPNTTMLSDGSASWAGDNDLEATLAQAGIPMTSTNATILEFDFTPISPNFSFDFIFASEEYGNFQCQFSDAFAFLLTNNSTGVTTNLAVVPNTTSPISVITIRDFIYNSSCPSANAEFFGNFNGGSAASASPTNFNGQTLVLNASTTLVPNTSYHIKLVIADRTDYESDSAIFLSSNSFNIGQEVLGPDLTVASSTAICPGESHVLNTGLNPAYTTFVWKQNGIIIPGAVGPTLTVTQPGVYSVIYNNTQDNCQPQTNTINIEYYPQMTTANPSNIYKCFTGALAYDFDLTLNTAVVTAGMTPLPVVTYHSSLSDANNNVNPLPTVYSSAGAQTIYVRINNGDTPCYVVKPFSLLVTPGPVAFQPLNIRRCSSSTTSPNGNFDLSQQIPLILNGQATAPNVVSFHTTAADANTGANPIPSGVFSAPNGTTVYARMQNVSDTNCFSTTSFLLFVSPLPLVDTLVDVIVCDSFTLPTLTNGNYFTGGAGSGIPLFAGDIITTTQTIYIYNQSGTAPVCGVTTSFKVTIIDPLTLSPSNGSYCTSYSLPVLLYGKYYTQPGGMGTQIPDGTTITTTQTIYVYYVAPQPPFCTVDTGFTVTILPAPNVPNYVNVFNCNSYTLPPLALGNYYTAPNGGGTLLAPGTAITSTQIIHVYAETGLSPVNCSDQSPFRVTIGFTPPADISQCEPYALPTLPPGGIYSTGPGGTGTIIPGGTLISASQTVYISNPSSGACMNNLSFAISIAQPPLAPVADLAVCESYTLPVLTSGTYYSSPGGNGTPLAAGDVITSDATIYVYAQSSATCFNELAFNIDILPQPAIDSRSDIDVCNSYTLTTLGAGNYYTGPNGTGTILPTGTVLTQSQMVYVYATSNTTPACTAQNSFELFIFSVQADDPADVMACDSYVLPPLTVGNYYLMPGGPASGEGTMLYAGDVITTNTTLYVYTESGERINCSDENEFTITITTSPVLVPMADQFACNSFTLPALALGEYYTGPGGTGTLLQPGAILTATQTVYVYAQSATVPSCTDEDQFEVTIFNVDAPANVLTCDNYVLPALTIGKYYTGQGGTGTQLQAGTVLTASQTLYIYATSPFNPTCTDEATFTITIVTTPVANSVAEPLRTVCDEDGTNDGITAFDLTTLSSTILGSQTGSEFTVAYYESTTDVYAETNPVTSTLLPIIYARVSNLLTPSCFTFAALTIHVNKLPVPVPVGGFVCFDTETQTLLGDPFTIHSGLTANSYLFQWSDAAGNIVGTGSTYDATAPGEYSVLATRISTGCTSEAAYVTISPSEPALVSYTVTENFSDSQTVTVVASGTGNYEYQLDNGTFQSSPIFENVSSGVHTVTVRDINGCDSSTSSALVVNYPHYFTPNADGHHDTWNINDLQAQLDSKISIFDRFGKLITQIKPGSAGWDGRYNGELMPSTDYWFVVNYTEDGQLKEFRAHFAMKR